MILTAEARAFLAEARTATLATIDPDGRPRLVPICFTLAADTGDAGPVIYSPIDEKPKTAADPRSLARVRDILARPDVGLLVDRWSEDWTQLAWLRVAGRATLLEAVAGTVAAAGAVADIGVSAAEAAGGAVVDAGTVGAERDAAIEALRAKYAQYLSHRLESRPILRITVERVTTWGPLAPVR